MHSNTVLIELGKNHWYTMYLMLIIISGDEEYNCIWFETRGENILEFQLGLYPSKTPSLHHCDNKNFLQKTWFTQVIVQFITFYSDESQSATLCTEKLLCLFYSLFSY